MWGLYALFLLGVSPVLGLNKHLFVSEVLLGGVIALPLCYLSTQRLALPIWARQLDLLLGNLAYPIFISHFLAFYLTERWLGIPTAEPLRFTLIAVLVCLVLSALLHGLQGWFERYRIARRGFDSLRELPTAP